VQQQQEILTTIGRDGKEALVATIGVTGDYQERIESSIEAGANIVLVDVAHGHHKNVKDAMTWINALSYRGKFDVILGNIATAKAALDLEEWGADALRVGIGGGSMCETRVRTGIGIPQLSALQAIVEVATIPVISDGGVRFPGDVAKALGAGADTVMVGSLFAGTDEAPGNVVIAGQWPNERRMKMFRGSASATAKLDVNGNTNNVEGASKLIETKGSVKKIVSDIMDGVRSSMSYVGAQNLSEFRSKARFIRITNAGLMEAHPHGLR
jgi:IMP dehydrogenase